MISSPRRVLLQLFWALLHAGLHIEANICTLEPSLKKPNSDKFWEARLQQVMDSDGLFTWRKPPDHRLSAENCREVVKLWRSSFAAMASVRQTPQSGLVISSWGFSKWWGDVSSWLEVLLLAGLLAVTCSKRERQGRAASWPRACWKTGALSSAGFPWEVLLSKYQVKPRPSHNLFHAFVS